MTDRKKTKKDTRSSITIKLPAAYADFVVGLLAKELADAHREGRGSLAATIQEILKPFRNAIELEDRLRTMRGQADRKRAAREPKQHKKQGGQE